MITVWAMGIANFVYLFLFCSLRGSLSLAAVTPPNSASVTFTHSNHDPKYKIAMHSADAHFHPEPGQDSITMTDRDGEKYECFLPNPEEKKGFKESNQQYSSSVTVVTDKQSMAKTPDDLLEMLKDQCLLRYESWWAYEFCYKGKLRQVHMEDKKLVQEFVLGVYDVEATAALHRNSPDVSLQKDPRSKTAAQRYHAHLYTNGTICDLTNEPRETEVRFMCSESKQPSINSIKEVSTCKYVLIVHCPKLCSHPLFQEERPSWYTINCNMLSSVNKRAEKEYIDTQLALSVDDSQGFQMD